MKKKFTQRIKTFSLMCFSCVLGVNAQGIYQLPNPDFELWEKGVKLDGTVTTYDEPVGWNSFGTGTGSLIGTAVTAMKNWTKQGNRGTEQEPNYYAIVYTGSFITTKGNGNMTTGIINAGSMSPANVANYNYTPLSSEGDGADNFRQKFTGRPDAMSVLLKYIPKKQTTAEYARVSAWIHNSNAKFQDPHEADITSKAVANALIEPSYADAIDWTKFVVDFDYADEYANNDPEYILISTSSNRVPGKGTAGDSLYIDDLYFIYHSSLADLKVKGESITGFDKDITTYTFESDAPKLEEIEAVSTSKWAAVETPSLKNTRDGSTVISIAVKGNDYQEGVNENITTYNLFYTPKTSTSIKNVTPSNDEKVYAADGYIHIANYNGLVEIYDVKGVKVYDKLINDNESVSLLSGTYIVRTGKGSTTVIIK